MAEPEKAWIGVADVAAEMGLTERQAWELIRKLGVPCVGPVRDRMRLARFSRADWIDARNRSLAPPTPRGRGRTGDQQVSTTAAAGRRTEGARDRLSEWRRGRDGTNN